MSSGAFTRRRPSSGQRPSLLPTRAVVQHLVATSEVRGVGALGRHVLAYAAEHGVPAAALSDLAIVASEICANVALHGQAGDDVTVSTQVSDGRVKLVVTGAGFGLSAGVDGPATRIGMVLVAARAHDLSVCETPDGGRAVSITLRWRPQNGR